MKKFNFDPRIKEGYFSADYFLKTREILKSYKPNQIITMQFFQRNDNVILCGINETISLLKFACSNFKELEIWYLNDGEIINELEPVLKITGKYSDFGWLEGIIDGILSRNTSIATNSNEVIKVVGKKSALNMLDRADSYLTLPSDGYASYIGGFKNFVTKAAIEYIDDNTIPTPSGTMPHALIQSFNGNTLDATKAFHKQFPNNNLVALIDYNNDCVTDALIVADYFKKNLWAIRVDTASNLIDKTIEKKFKGTKTKFPINGVSMYLIQELRQALNNAGHNHVKIIASSGFTPEKIKLFEDNNIPVDIYGVGNYLAKINVSFTGDAVLIDGVPEAKFGRSSFESKRLIKYMEEK